MVASKWFLALLLYVGFSSLPCIICWQLRSASAAPPADAFVGVVTHYKTISHAQQEEVIEDELAEEEGEGGGEGEEDEELLEEAARRASAATATTSRATLLAASVAAAAAAGRRGAWARREQAKGNSPRPRPKLRRASASTGASFAKNVHTMSHALPTAHHYI